MPLFKNKNKNLKKKFKFLVYRTFIYTLYVRYITCR